MLPQISTLRILRSPDASFSVLALCLGPTQRLVCCKRIYLPVCLFHHRERVVLFVLRINFFLIVLITARHQINPSTFIFAVFLFAFFSLFSVESASVRLYIFFLYIYRYLRELIFMRLTKVWGRCLFQCFKHWCELLTEKGGTFQAYLGEVLGKLCNKRVWVAVRHERFGCLVIRHVTTHAGTPGYMARLPV